MLFRSESKLIAKDAIDFTGLDFNGVRGKGFFGMISGGIKLLKAMSRCKSLMRELKPDVMFTTGGYVAVPVASDPGNLPAAVSELTRHRKRRKHVSARSCGSYHQMLFIFFRHD